MQANRRSIHSTRESIRRFSYLASARCLAAGVLLSARSRRLRDNGFRETHSRGGNLGERRHPLSLLFCPSLRPVTFHTAPSVLHHRLHCRPPGNLPMWGIPAEQFSSLKTDAKRVLSELCPAKPDPPSTSRHPLLSSGGGRQPDLGPAFLARNPLIPDILALNPLIFYILRTKACLSH